MLLNKMESVSCLTLPRPVCPMGSSRTWLLITASVQMVASCIMLLISVLYMSGAIWAAAAEVDKKEVATGISWLFRVAPGLFVAVSIIWLLGVCFPILAEKQKRSGWLIPWSILIVMDFHVAIGLLVSMIAHWDATPSFSTLFTLGLHLYGFLVIKVIVTRRRYEELQRLPGDRRVTGMWVFTKSCSF